MPELLHLQIEMLVLPGSERRLDAVPQPVKGSERPTAFVELAADRRFGQIKMTVAARVIAFAVELDVFFGAERFAFQAMGRTKSVAKTEEKFLTGPGLREKVRALMEANATDRDGSGGATVNVSGERFSRDRLIG